jgi:basic amino acid/polyamine antiporter, APA family
MTGGVGRASIITAVTLTFAWINVRGIRQSAIVINLFTIAKLAPLALFIIVGAWFIDPSRFTPLGTVSPTQASTGALLLVFAYAGYPLIAVPPVRRPTRAGMYPSRSWQRLSPSRLS